MDTIDVILIIAILFLICLSAFFSATETAFSSVNKIRLKNLASNGNKKAARALKMSENYDELRKITPHFAAQ
ncbi:MAG: CNNM domain-containing protein [Acutalibacteraceae bacterium]